MFLDGNSFISRAIRHLWLLPTFVIPSALGFCFIVPEPFGSRLTAVVLVLFIAQISISAIIWKNWKRTYEQLAGVRHELSSLRNSSLKDDLTGLFNRRGFLKQAAPYFDFARRQKGNLLLLFIDLDGMKRINDEFGHNEGDNALINTAAILNRSFRNSDIIARLGGDEFTVLITDLNANKESVIARLNENLRAHNAGETRSHKLAFSIGVATLEPERMTCFEELLEQADRAMYEQKRMKRRNVKPQIYTDTHRLKLNQCVSVKSVA